MNKMMIKEEKLSIFYQNCNGFLGKRTEFLNSSILQNHNIIILQETNLKKKHSLVDDFSYQNFSSLILSHAETGTFCRGSLIAYNNNLAIPPPEIVKLNIPQIYEIRCVRIMFPAEPVFFISAYRSPSMNKIQQDEFFTALQIAITAIAGKVFLIGDLNICADRYYASGITEDIFIERLTDCGLKNRFEGVTRDVSGRQLDYVFSNFDVIRVVVLG